MLLAVDIIATMCYTKSMSRGAPFRERIPIMDRFWSKVHKTDFCWVWTAFINPDGYGIFGIGSRTDGSRRIIHAHRWIYLQTYGSIPDGYEIDHLCKNRACVRPDHLEAVSHKVNSQRADLSGNGEWQRIKTHCPQGHPYTPENTHTYRGMKKCRTCDKLRHQAKRKGLPYP